MGPTSWLKGW